jgi:hypothetical protein
MKIAALVLVAAVLGQNGQDTSAKPVTFNDPQLGLLFDHPASWQVKKNAKSKKTSKTEKGITTFSIPTSTSLAGGTLEIYHAKFASTPDIWQTVQLRSNEQLHRTVDRQWQQDILGVPLLLTRISYSDSGTAETTLTGLLYTRTHDKLLFRLNGPTSEFDNLQYAFTSAMQTLRTVDGAMPVEEDPDHPLAPAKKGDPANLPKVSLFAKDKPAKLVIAAKTASVTVSTKQVTLHFPEEWQVAESNGTTITLKSSDVSAPVTITLYSALDSEPPSAALQTLAAKDLEEFDTVGLRLDQDPKANQAGCTVSSVWRAGKSKGSDLYSYEACGSQGDYYFIANFRGKSAKSADDDHEAIDELLHALSLQLQP